jgi:hypothetical protein
MDRRGASADRFERLQYPGAAGSTDVKYERGMRQRADGSDRGDDRRYRIVRNGYGDYVARSYQSSDVRRYLAAPTCGLGDFVWIASPH